MPQNENTPTRPDDLEERVGDDIGGVQGEPEDEAGQQPERPALGSPDEEPAPDAGEIEWAGQVVKKPPTPQP